MAPAFAQDPQIFRLIRQGTPQDVVAALASGANPNAQTADGKHTPLVFLSEIHMSETYRREMMDALIKAGAEIDHPAPAGDRPFHAAVRRGDKALAQFYLDRGADIHALDAKGDTALHIAAQTACIEGRTDMMEFLLKAGANSLLRNKAGQTPLAAAKASESTRVFGRTPVQFLQAWEGRKDSLRARFEKIHADRGLGAADAARDHDRLGALAKQTGTLRIKPRPPAPPKG